MMGSFKWLEKFGQVMLSIPDEGMRMRFAYALVLYGTTGEVLELEWPLGSLLLACMEDVDYSKAATQQGGKGGRPRRSTPSREGSEAPCGEDAPAPARADGEGNPTAENPESGVSETPKGGFPDSRKGGFANPETHSIAMHSNALHSTLDGERACAPAPAPAMKHPTVDDVVLFAKAQTLAAVPDLEGEASRFVNHFAAQGWVRSNGMAVRDWRPLWAKWVAERPLFAAPRGQPAPERRDEAREHAAALAARYGDEARTEVVA